MPEHTVQQILERLVASRFVQTFEGLKGNRVYRITAAGLSHPQRDNFTRHAEAPRPPVNQTVFAKCFLLFGMRGRFESET